MGDAEASLGFYARADEISPRNARVKAGMASAFVQLGQPQAALRLFEEAASLGAPAAEFAADRGLAFDMVGDPARAQQEYVLAMRNRDEPELRLRMALSLAITGQRDAALRLIDAQLRRHDRAAWRTQAFVLALTGDTAGATHTPAASCRRARPRRWRRSWAVGAPEPVAKSDGGPFWPIPEQWRGEGGNRPGHCRSGALALAMGGAPAATPPDHPYGRRYFAQLAPAYRPGARFQRSLSAS
jgi:tetratricopeptide (TPR) repeat protein